MSTLQSRDDRKIQDSSRLRWGWIVSGAVILEIALIICSLTLLTRKKGFWYSGMAIGVFGFFVGVSGFLVR